MAANAWQRLREWYDHNPLVKLSVNVITGALVAEATVVCLKVIVALGMHLTSLLPFQPADNRFQGMFSGVNRAE